MVGLLRRFDEVNGGPPQRVLFYRDGVLVRVRVS